MALLAPTPYATISDLTTTGIVVAALGTLSTLQQQAFLDEANAKIDSYIGAKFKLPLVSWGADLRGASVSMSAFSAIAMRGFDPEDEGDKVFASRKNEALRWLEQIAKGEVTPVVVDSTSGGTGGAGGNPFTAQARTTVNSTQPTLDGQVTVSASQQSGVVVTGRPTLRGWDS